MINNILFALLNESKAFLEGTGGQIMLRTNFKPSKLPDYTMPLVLLSLDNAEDSFQYPGGLTQMGWKIGFNSYNYEPDAFDDDPSEYSTNLLYFPIDAIRQHFSLGALGNGVVYDTGVLRTGIIYMVENGSITYDAVLLPKGTYFTAIDGQDTFTTTNDGYAIGTSWLTQGMVTIFNDFGFQFTLSGVTAADALEESGIVMGYKISFDTTALDSITTYTKCDRDLETVTQIDNPPFSPDDPIS